MAPTPITPSLIKDTRTDASSTAMPIVLNTLTVREIAFSDDIGDDAGTLGRDRPHPGTRRRGIPARNTRRRDIRTQTYNLSLAAFTRDVIARLARMATSQARWLSRCALCWRHPSVGQYPYRKLNPNIVMM
jgi:hypothetical protein